MFRCLLVKNSRLNVQVDFPVVVWFPVLKLRSSGGIKGKALLKEHFVPYMKVLREVLDTDLLANLCSNFREKMIKGNLRKSCRQESQISRK